jgi:hypothetical protein
MLKTTFDKGDTVDYLYSFPPPLAPIEGRIKAKVVSTFAIDGQIAISITNNQGVTQQLYVPIERLTSCVEIESLPQNIEKDRYTKASKLGYRQIKSDRMLFDSNRDKFYRLDELEQEYEDDDDDDEAAQPKYLFLTKSHQLKISAAEDTIEYLVSSCKFEDEDTYSIEQWQELIQLEAAIAKFNLANKDKIVYSVDYSQVVLLDQAFV